AIRQGQRTPTYLSEVVLDPRLRVTDSIPEAVKGAPVVVSVSPSHVVRGVMTDAKPHMRDDALVVSASKGIEEKSLETMDRVLVEVFGDRSEARMAFLSGPSF